MTVGSIRNRIWNNMANIKFKAIFTYECYRLSDRFGRYYSMFLALVSTSSVAAWAIWKSHPTIWAVIVGIAQLLHVAKPYIPLIKHDKSFIEMSCSFEPLYLQYEKLWCEHERENISEDEAEKRFYVLREKEIEIEKSHKHADCPRHQYLIDYAVGETNKALARNLGGIVS